MRHNWTLLASAREERAHLTTGRSPGVWAGLVIAVAASMAVGGYAADEARPAARLSTISARMVAAGASVFIESSEPVAYVTTRPDPLTVLVDLRNVTTAGVLNRLAAAPVGPVAAVTLEDLKASDGASVARVRLLLAVPAQHKVHSDRNVIQVDVLPDRGPLAATAAPAAVVLGAPRPATAATRLEAIRTSAGPHSIEVTLAGNGTLVASATEATRTAPHRLVLDFTGVAAAVPAVTPVGKGAIERVRVAAHSTKPLITRVVFDLARQVPYTVKSSGNELKVIFTDGTPAAPAAATSSSSSSSLSAPAPPPPLPPKAPPAEPVKKAAEPPAPPVAPAAPAPQPAPPARPEPPAPPQAPPTINQQVPQVTAAQPRQYTGNPISMDFAGSDLRAVLRVFAEQSSLNLVIDPKVEGTVDVTLRDVPWDQALDMILRTNKLGYVVDGPIVRIAPLSVLADEESARRKLGEEQVLSGDLKVMTKTLSYAQATDVEPLLKGNALSSRGTTAVDKRTNTVIINDLPAYLTKADALLTTLDQPEGQVEIEARIVSTSKTFARELGVKWGFLGQAVPELGNTTSVAFPNAVVGTGTVDLSANTKPAPSAVQLALGSINGAFNIDVALSALEKEGRIKILLTPRIVTQNNVKAKIARGQEIPYTTTTAPPQTGQGGVIIAQPLPTVQFKTAALTLEVTPRITPADTILLEVDVDNGSPGETQANGNVSINTQRATTKVLVKDAATTVIGGIYSSQSNHTDGRTPGLGKIPLLRWLFKNETINDTEDELLIFITPRIIRVK